MRTLGAFAGKGGAKKSTIICQFALWLDHNHGAKVLVIDTDSQGSAMKFFGRRKQNELETSVQLTHQPHGETTEGKLNNIFKKAEDGGFDYVLIDTAGREDNFQFTRMLLKLCDKVVVPFPISGMGYEEMLEYKDKIQAELENREIRVALSTSQTRAVRYFSLIWSFFQGRREEDFNGVNTFETVITHFADYDSAGIAGKSLSEHKNSVAAKQLENLFIELKDYIDE